MLTSSNTHPSPDKKPANEMLIMSTGNVGTYTNYAHNVLEGGSKSENTVNMNIVVTVLTVVNTY
jgi:hypothetical protein